ncbi:MAG: NADPH:quinone oxidoreductase family protein [Acidimicrobiales bacterium]|jgi:NADPH:quinone reductase-like Zn-dependent oxidoreductase|nr:NADPH:quinone oxidoreductase family protein [Acidimicrobiales bacterium]
MRALRCVHHGPPEDLEVVELPDPTAGPGEVVVTVHAAAANFPDVLIVADRYQMSVPAPFTPGSELAGAVLAVGEGVDDLRPGDLVYGTTAVGAFAEQAVLPRAALRRVPAGVPTETAAAFGVTYATAYHALHSVAGVAPGDRVAVLGAAGGVGLATIDLARAAGAEVVAVVGGAEKAELCRARGAAAVVDHTIEDPKAAVRAATDGGADVVVDPVGGALSEPLLRAMRWGGRFVCVGFASGEIPAIPLNLVLLKGVTVAAFEFGGFATHRPDLVAAGTDALEDLLARGVVAPHIGGRYPLTEAADALRALAGRTATGKLLIVPDTTG